MLELVEQLKAVARSAHPVLLLGERGCGKSPIARALHENGPRASRPFVTKNCATMTATLAETTLFGHVRGAFSGATQPSRGLFREADKGTLFLDEIGELPEE